ncbi:MAG: hypothetical protein E7185_06250 [Erysipelotrichaceae bacterium]|nr:hypothetical protein [Erysipelotrichaceae bacterium]
MLKTIKTILMWVAIVLIVGGLLVLFYQYTINKNLFHVLMNNSVVQGSLGVLQKMLWATLAMLVGFMLLSASFKLGSYVKQREEEKRIAALQKAADKLALEERMKQQEAQAEARVQSAGEAIEAAKPQQGNSII